MNNMSATRTEYQSDSFYDIPNATLPYLQNAVRDEEKILRIKSTCTNALHLYLFSFFDVSK